MKPRLWTWVWVAAALQASSLPAQARPEARSNSSFESGKRFGVGASLGAPFAVRAHLYLGRDTAIEAGVGSYYRLHLHPLDQGGFHAHVALLAYPAVLVKHRNFWLPFYVGVGARYIDHGAYEHRHLGARFPVGALLDFECAPVDLFLEFALSLDVSTLDNRSYHEMPEVAGSIGGRYYF